MSRRPAAGRNPPVPAPVDGDAQFLITRGWKFKNRGHAWSWLSPPPKAWYTLKDALDLERSRKKGKK